MQCRCKNTRHANHLDKPCTVPATEIDNYCKYCHDKAADEAMAAILPTNQPIQVQDRFRLADSFSIERVREFYKTSWWAILLVVIFAIISTGIGLVVSGLIGAGIGFLISVLTAILLPPIRATIREIERRP